MMKQGPLGKKLSEKYLTAIHSIGFYWFQNLAMTLLMNRKRDFWLANTLMMKKRQAGPNIMSHPIQNIFR